MHDDVVLMQSLGVMLTHGVVVRQEGTTGRGPEQQVWVCREDYPAESTKSPLGCLACSVPVEYRVERDSSRSQLLPFHDVPELCASAGSRYSGELVWSTGTIVEPTRLVQVAVA